MENNYLELLNEETIRKKSDNYRSENLNLNKDIKDFSLYNTKIEGFYQSFVRYYDKNFKKSIEGIGFTQNEIESKHIALLEAFERYTNILLNEEFKIYKGKYLDAKKIFDNVFNPNIISKKDYKDKVFDWIEGFSWNLRKNILIPVDFICYGNPNYVYKSNSNGAAVGKNMVEATFFAVLELIERDSFLNHWYLKKVPIEIDLSCISYASIKSKVKMIEDKGYTVHLYILNTETKIPVVWLLAKGINNDSFANYSTTASHINPINAINKAFDEMLFGLINYTDTNAIRKKAYYILENGAKEIADHPTLYFLSEMDEYFNFLNDSKKIKYHDLFSNINIKSELDLKKELHNLLNNLDNSVGDIYIVRLTTNEVSLESVKVLIPGFQQLWFGCDNTNISNLRLNQMAKYWNINRHMKLNNKIHPYP